MSNGFSPPVKRRWLKDVVLALAVSALPVSAALVAWTLQPAGAQDRLETETETGPGSGTSALTELDVHMQVAMAVPVDVDAEVDVDVDRAAARGEYVLRSAGCVSCHTRSADEGFLAGGRAIESPFGRFFGPNITPDPETGIGSWSLEDFARALRYGVAPDGRHYYPAFPYTSYAAMTPGDVADLWAYLRTVDPVYRPNQAHELVWYARFRVLLAPWKWFYHDPQVHVDQPGRSAEENRGAYLAAIGHCAECHSPRSRSGAIPEPLRYAGSRLPDGDVAPNITPDRETGIGQWRPHHLMRYLELGMTPDGDFAGGGMADVIEEGTRHLTPEDRRALVVYLRALPPIQHRISD